MGTVINYTPGTKVWVRLEGKKMLAVFKGPVPALWGGASLLRRSREERAGADR